MLLFDGNVAFPNSKKDVVSGLDMLNLLSIPIFDRYGQEETRLAAIEKFRWPYPLQRDEEARMQINERGKQVLQGLALKSFSTHMVGLRSKKVVMFGNCTIITPP